MYNSYHSLMTTLKSLYLVFCSNKLISNPDFVVRLQVTILKRSQTANDSVRYSSRSALNKYFFKRDCAIECGY